MGLRPPGEGCSVHLKSITMKGFKSFPDRTRLEFAPGISVVVGPNGSGKSNVTDAVLWAMGEQSPLAVRGQSMQDVIFGGGRGVQARGAAEVELVIDNGDGALDLPMSEISILRRLDRAGEGEYRLNGARCRLVDVIEVLSDTGLGKEMHSVISQGRVEAIVTSKPRDRRLLIEEAAGWASIASAAAAPSSSSSAPRTTSTARSTSSARLARGCARSSARPRRPSCMSASPCRSARRAGSSRATICATAAPSSTRPRAPPGPRGRPWPRWRASSSSSRPAARRPSRRWPSAPSSETAWPGARTQGARRPSASSCAQSTRAPPPTACSSGSPDARPS